MAGGGFRLELGSVGLQPRENLRPFGLSDLETCDSQVFWQQVFGFCALSSQAGLDVSFRHLKFGIPGDW